MTCYSIIISSSNISNKLFSVTLYIYFSEKNKMSVHSILLDFKLPSDLITDEGIKASLKSTIYHILENNLTPVTPLTKVNIHGSFIETFIGPSSSTITIRGFAEGIITMSIEYLSKNNEELFAINKIKQLEAKLKAAISATTSQSLPVISRGNDVQKYFTSSDERLLEYDIDVLLFEERSKYQNVQIFHSKSLGNILVLDGWINISEADLIYTETLMQRGKENYSGKEIVILGGGDGALLWELLKENPKNVLMLEIDDVVMKACNEYMTSICGDCLDKKKGDNYKIITGDCIEVLKSMINKFQYVDYVFGDLTDIPIDTNVSAKTWEFIEFIITLAIKIIRPGGKYMTHANGACFPAALRIFEKLFDCLEGPITYTSSSAFVPSFYEEWVFYQLTKGPSIQSQQN